MSQQRMGTKTRKVKLRKVVERDGKNCWLCGEPVDFDPPHVHDPQAPSLEHVRPLQDGGPHNLENLRLAHRRCNR